MISKEQMKKQSQWVRACAREAARNKKLQDERRVMVQKAYDLKHRCDAVVDLAYGDLTLIITMLHDYVTILDESEADNVQYQYYLRGRFLHIAESLERQLGYDYKAAVERCRKKHADKQDDIGGDALELTIKRGAQAEQARERERKKKEQEEAERLAKKPSGRKGETSRDDHMEQLSLFDMS